MNKFHVRCSCVVCNKETTTQSINAHYNTHFKKPIGKCLNCDFEIYTGKFCSKKCSEGEIGIYTNSKKDFTKIKTGPPKGFIPANVYPYTKVKICAICRKWYNCNSYKAKTCSIECYKLLQKQGQQKHHYGNDIPEKVGKIYRDRIRSRIMGDNKKIKNIYKFAKIISNSIGTKYHVDHAIPVSKGGEHHEDNLIIMRWDINLKKSSELSEYWLTVSKILNFKI